MRFHHRIALLGLLVRLCSPNSPQFDRLVAIVEKAEAENDLLEIQLERCKKLRIINGKQRKEKQAEKETRERQTKNENIPGDGKTCESLEIFGKRE